MNKKIFLFTVAAAISLAGCGGGSGSGSSMSSSSVVSSSIQMSSVNEVSSSSEISSSNQMSSASEVSLSSAINISSQPGSADAVSSSSVMSSANQTSSVIVVVPSSSMSSSSQMVSSSEAALSSGISSSSQSSSLSADVPLPIPTYGFNLGNTFESTWGFPVPTQAVFTSAANAGFNAVRIPCAWDFNADKVTYKINPAYMAQVKQAVDWSLAAGMHVLINIHWDGGWMENNIGNTVDSVIDAKLRSYWTQIATEFADYDNRLLFAAANEPNVHNIAENNTLMAYYDTFIDAVRTVGGNNTNRWLVLQGGGDPSWFTTLPSDPTPGRLMVEYHNYTPTQFTLFHEDPSWGRSFYFWGPAYHYVANPTRNATWGEEGTIDAEFQQLKEQFVDKGVPVLIGEFHASGVSTLTGDEKIWNNASRLYWNKYVTDSIIAHGLSPFYWSTPNAPFDYQTGEITDPDLVTALTGGMAPPPPNGAPYAASGLTATSDANGQVNLSWTAGSGATSYSLYRAAQSGSSSTSVVTGITGTSYTDTGLNDGTTYYYKVVAVNIYGPSGFSAEAYATTPGINPDPTKFHFESDTQRWSASGGQITGIATSTEQSFAGKQSLAVSFNGATNGQSELKLSNVVLPAGTTVTFRVWIPAGHQITKIEPYAQDYNWNWTAGWYGTFVADSWNTLTVTVPSGATTPLKNLGLKIDSGAAWAGTLYVDSINWTVE